MYNEQFLLSFSFHPTIVLVKILIPILPNVAETQAHTYANNFLTYISYQLQGLTAIAVELHAYFFSYHLVTETHRAMMIKDIIFLTFSR